MSGRASNRVESAIALAALLIYVAWMLAPAMQASFAMIDDHETVYRLGSDRTMPLSEMPSQIARVTAEHVDRLQHVYWATRIVQIGLLGDRPTLWHATHIGMGLLTASCLFLVLRQLSALRPWQCSVVSAIFFAGPQSEIWARLGATEAEAILVTVIGLCLLARQVRLRRTNPAALALGILVMSTSAFVKETFIPLAPLAFLIFAVVIPAQATGCRPWRVIVRWRRADWVWAIAFVALWLLNLAAIVFVMRKHGHQYATEPTHGAFVQTIRQVIRMIAQDSAYLVGIPIALLAVAEAQWRIKPALAELAILVGIVIAGFVTIALPQAYLYAGLFGEARYRIPANLAAVVIVAACFHRIRVSASDPSRKKPLAAGQYSPRIVFEFALAAVIVWHCIDRAKDVREQTTEYAGNTRKFSALIDRLHRAAGPAETGVVIQGGWVSYEAIFSTQRYLHFHEPNRKIAIRAVTQGNGPLAGRLERHLREIQDHGQWGLVPLDEVRRLGAGHYIEIMAFDASLPPEADRVYRLQE